MDSEITRRQFEVQRGTWSMKPPILREVEMMVFSYSDLGGTDSTFLIVSRVCQNDSHIFGMSQGVIDVLRGRDFFYLRSGAVSGCHGSR